MHLYFSFPWLHCNARMRFNGCDWPGSVLQACLSWFSGNQALFLRYTVYAWLNSQLSHVGYVCNCQIVRSTTGFPQSFHEWNRAKTRQCIELKWLGEDNTFFHSCFLRKSEAERKCALRMRVLYWHLFQLLNIILINLWRFETFRNLVCLLSRGCTWPAMVFLRHLVASLTMSELTQRLKHGKKQIRWWEIRTA